MSRHAAAPLVSCVRYFNYVHVCVCLYRDRLGDPGVDGRIMLRWIVRKWDVGVWTGSSWLRIGTGGGHL